MQGFRSNMAWLLAHPCGVVPCQVPGSIGDTWQKSGLQVWGLGKPVMANMRRHTNVHEEASQVFFTTALNEICLAGLLEVLKQRASVVRTTLVDAMLSNASFDTPFALHTRPKWTASHRFYQGLHASLIVEEPCQWPPCGSQDHRYAFRSSIHIRIYVHRTPWYRCDELGDPPLQEKISR